MPLTLLLPGIPRILYLTDPCQQVQGQVRERLPQGQEGGGAVCVVVCLVAGMGKH